MNHFEIPMVNNTINTKSSNKKEEVADSEEWTYIEMPCNRNLIRHECTVPH